MEYRRDETRVYLVVYHLVWAPKRRKAVLTGRLREDCERLIREKCASKGWEVLELSVQPDHLHLFVSVFPTVSPAEVVKECKGVTARELRRQYPELLRLPSMWTRSYFAATAGNVSQETIARYIADQRGK